MLRLIYVAVTAPVNGFPMSGRLNMIKRLLNASDDQIEFHFWLEMSQVSIAIDRISDDSEPSLSFATGSTSSYVPVSDIYSYNTGNKPFYCPVVEVLLGSTVEMRRDNFKDQNPSSIEAETVVLKL